jgi:putative hydrolase of the HAD superfamily
VIEGVTFDFWNTLMWEEPGSLKEKRLEAWAESLAELGVGFDQGRLEAAHDSAHIEYVSAWKAGRQFRVDDAVAHMAERLGTPVTESVREALVEGFDEGGRRAAVHPSDGVAQCLKTLRAADVRLGIICDIGLTPSPVVIEVLDRAGLVGHFAGMSFSDKVGYYKPDRRIFEHALASLGGVAPERAAHVGDRRRTDVAGAAAMGMTAIRYNGVYEDDDLPLEADLVVSELAELPSALGAAEVSR